MKIDYKIVILLALSFFPKYVMAAGGSCNAIPVPTGVTGCYYVAANGLDTNTGLDENHPWLHAKGMPACSGTCSSATVNAGTGIIFRGGDTWHYGTGAPLIGGAWNFTVAGNATNPVYIGVDKTWFTGASWQRPILNGDNPLNQDVVASCAFNDLSLAMVTIASFDIFDNFELTGFCWDGNPSAGNVGGIKRGGNGSGAAVNTQVENVYIHGWTATTAGATNDSWSLIVGGDWSSNNGLSNNVIGPGVVIDGQDSSGTTSNCSTSVYGTSPCHTGFMIGGDCYYVHDSIFRYGSNINCINNTIAYNMVLENESVPIFSGQHPNLWESDQGAAGPQGSRNTYFFNNLIRTTLANGGSGVGIWLQADTHYEFNNVLWGMSSSRGTGGANCWMESEWDNLSTPNGNYGGYQNGHLLFNNNTVVPPCLLQFYGQDGNSTTWFHNGIGDFANDHLVGYASLTSFYLFGQRANGTVNNNGGVILATSGYTSANNYAPTSGTAATVGAGTNLTSTCTAIPFTIAATLCQSGAPTFTYNTTNHTLIVTPGNPRPATGAWDSGAYQFSSGSNPQASTPTFSPVGGTYSGTQSVTISTTSTGAIICYTTNGTTPVTNGTTGCTTGTLVAGAVAVSASETINAVAGGTGFTDSAPGIASYTILIMASSPTFSPVAGSYTSGPTLVSLSTTTGSVICYNFVGSPGPINGGSTCPSGSTLYTGQISVPIGYKTIFAIAGGVGFTDSSISSAAYTVYGNVTWAGIVDTTRAIDWTNAGVKGGIINRTTKCGPTINASGDTNGLLDVSNINTAIQNARVGGSSNCVANSFIQLGGTPSSPQTFYICGGITFGSPQNSNSYINIVNNITLRGGGPTSTILKAICGGKQEQGSNSTIIGISGVTTYNPTNTYPMSCNWTGGYNKNNTLLTVTGCTSGTSLAPGMIVILDQRNSSIGLSGTTSPSCLASGTGNTTITCTTSIPHNYTVNTGNTCPDNLTDCVIVGGVGNGTGTTGTATCNAFTYSLFNTPCNTPNKYAPITAVTANTFTYTVTTGPSCTTPPCPSNNAGYSDVDTGGVWVTNVPAGTVDEQASEGRNCPDPIDAQCNTNEISFRSQAEVKQIVGVCTGLGTGTGTGVTDCQNANQVIIDNGLYHNNWNANYAPGLWSMDCSPNSTGATLCPASRTSNYAQGVGVEGMTLDGNLDGGADTTSLFSFYRAYNSWAKNVRCLYGDRNCMWVRDGSAHLTFQDNYVGFGKGSATQSYGIEMFGDISDILVSNGIYEHAVTGVMWGGCFGCVTTDNYFWDDGSYTTPIMFNMQDLNHDYQSFVLSEGNNNPFCHIGNVHGTLSGPMTIFRSRCRGQTPGGPWKSNGLDSLQFSANNRGINLIGSVLGWPNTLNGVIGQIHYQETGFSSQYIMSLNKTSENDVAPTDPLVGKSLYCWGNYDVFNNTIAWAGVVTAGNGCLQAIATLEVPAAFTYIGAQAVPSSHTLPASFFYPLQPIYWITKWGTPKWPPIGPDVLNGAAPDCVPAGNCLSDNTPSQLTSNNLPYDPAYLTTNTISGASWATTAGGTIQWTGSFAMEPFETFKVTGAGAYNTGPGGAQVIQASGPARSYIPTLAAVAGGSVCATLPCTISVLVTRVQSSGGETHPSPGNAITLSGANNSFTVTSPGASGGAINGVGAGDAAATFNVYAAIQFSTPLTKFCLQGSSTIGVAFTLTTALKGIPCQNPPVTSTAISTTITSYLPGIGTGPGTYPGGGVMTYPLILAYDAATAYPAAYPVVNPIIPSPSSVIFTKLSFPKDPK